MSTEANHGCVVWFDLMTTDPPAAVDFYTRLVGWGTQEWTGLDTPYTMWANGDTPLGGVVQLPPEARANGAAPHWLAYLAVADVDRTVESSVQLGGSVVHAPTDIASVGRFAVIRHPQGAMIAIYRSANESADAAAYTRRPDRKTNTTPLAAISTANFRLFSSSCGSFQNDPAPLR